MIEYNGPICRSADEARRRRVKAGQDYIRAKQAYKRNSECPMILAELGKARVLLENSKAVIKEWVAPKTDESEPRRLRGRSAAQFDLDAEGFDIG